MRHQRAIGEKPAVAHANLDNKKAFLQGFCTAATGLEPATSGDRPHRTFPAWSKLGGDSRREQDFSLVVLAR